MLRKAKAGSTLLILNVSTPPFASAWLVYFDAHAILLVIREHCKPACTFLAVFITFAIFTKVCACISLWVDMAFAGCSALPLSRLISPTTAGRWKNCSLLKHRRHPGSKNRVAAGCLIFYFFGCLVMGFDHSLLRPYPLLMQLDFFAIKLIISPPPGIVNSFEQPWVFTCQTTGQYRDISAVLLVMASPQFIAI